MVAAIEVVNSMATSPPSSHCRQRSDYLEYSHHFAISTIVMLIFLAIIFPLP